MKTVPLLVSIVLAPKGRSASPRRIVVARKTRSAHGVQGTPARQRPVEGRQYEGGVDYPHTPPRIPCTNN